MKLPSPVSNASPLAGKLRNYHREDFVGDMIAGVIVAIMLIPQAMAYAMLAGLPPQIGLYASIVPLLLYSIFGSSNYIAVGPVAMVSLIVVSGVSELATPGSEEFIGYCLTLALLIGVIQIVMALFRLGFLVNFISHPVLVGFTSAAAIIIGASQLKHLLGVSVASSEYPFMTIVGSVLAACETNLPTFLIGVSAITVLLFFQMGFSRCAQRLGLSKTLSDNLAKLGPLVAVIAAAATVAILDLNEQASVAIVGEIPAGLPGVTLPSFAWGELRAIAPLAFVITLVGYLESVSVAKALASRRREKVDANRELFALGMADLGSAFTGGYPVTGGFSRSLVNFSAGARTPLGSVITALIVAVSVAILTPAFYYIPNAVLAAIIIVAVVKLIDVKAPFKLWRYSRADAAALVVTFMSVLTLGIETGILVGVTATIVMLMWKMSRPHVAEIGRMPGGLGFRNVKRHAVETIPHVFAFRVDESLYFANAPFLESYIINQIATRPETRSVLLVCSGMNDIDDTGLEVLRTIDRELDEIGVGFFLAEVKGPVTDRMRLAGFADEFMNDRVFLTTLQAIETITTLGKHDAPKERVDQTFR